MFDAVAGFLDARWSGFYFDARTCRDQENQENQENEKAILFNIFRCN